MRQEAMQKILQTRPDAPQLQFERYFTGIIKKCKNELIMLTRKKPDKEGIMTTKESEQLFERAILSADRSGNRSGIQPGRINLGSHLNQRNSLSARVKAEIDGRLHF
jgi:hypothetical protein